MTTKSADMDYTVKNLNQLILSDLCSDEKEIEAKIIVEHLTKLDYSKQLIHNDEKISKSTLDKAREIVFRRNNGEPLQYIIGKAEFYSLSFFVGNGVLIPRQDTETLVDEALDYIRKNDCKSVLDLCSGSGCIAVAIEKNAPNCNITAVEKYDEAYSYLQKNIAASKSKNITAIKSDALKYNKYFDLVVSNPPYVNKSLKESLQKEVLFEPHNALFADDDGLYFYKKIAKNYANNCKAIMFEIGEEQGESVSEILKQNGFENVRVVKDICQNDRVCIGYAENIV